MNEALRQAESRSGDEAAWLPFHLLTPTSLFEVRQIRTRWFLI